VEKQQTFLLPPKMNSAALVREVKKNFLIKLERKEYQQLTFFDTFDWRLFNNSSYLIQNGDQLSVHSFPDELQLCEYKWQKLKAPEFWWEFTDSALKNYLKSVIDLRALILIGSLERHRQRLRILNEDEKTVVVGDIEVAKTVDARNIYQIYLRPVRGYSKEFQNICLFLQNLGLAEEQYKTPFQYLKFDSHKPGEYSSKLQLGLIPDMPGKEAMKQIGLLLMDVAEKNLDGMKRDIDTEFLHDFRVSIRRTRAAINQIKGIYTPEKTVEFKQKFSEIGKFSNRLRDLDVYLYHKDYYYTLVPEIFRQGLDILFTKLAKQRAYEQKKLVGLIDSGIFTKAFNEWRSFLKSDNLNHLGPNADIPIFELARGYIYRQYMKVYGHGSKIKKSTPDRKIHDLRIECKKLRYLLEFFSSLFPAEDIAYLVRQLKMLQDNLGDFNDLAVQQMEMQEYLEEVNWNQKTAQTITAALGGLIASLHNKQQIVRDEFFKTFATFSSPENVMRFEKLFRPLNTQQEQF